MYICNFFSSICIFFSSLDYQFVAGARQPALTLTAFALVVYVQFFTF